ncbi:MAG TPA: ComEC/Rec2 family competence protein, partial [Candidatus Limnocylindria bacterium]|nr:ComEC/Rec2 family competence protein [Candidatus Limnocylindria bacterium]
MGPTQFVLPATLGGVALGVLAADAIGLPPLPAVIAGTAAAAVALIIRSGGLALIGVALLALAVGCWRGGAGEPADAGASVAALADGAEHDITGTVMDDPRPREDRLQLVLGQITADGLARSDRLLVWLPRGIDAHSGEVVRVSSEVEIAEDFDGFAYRDYLARQGIGAIARANSASVVAEGTGPASLMAALRATLLGGLNDLVPEPEAALGAGILLGVRASIAPEINDAFSTAGLTHVVAISGWNIAIVAALVAAAVRPLARRPGGRWTTATIAAAVIAGYVILTGASPSVVRAALMAAAMLVARLGGSRAHASSALAMAALVMLLAAPPVLWDVGFQLSLLATAGLVWFGASVERRLARWPGWLREPVALTLAAQLTTLPVILVNFERLSLVAPIANVLVVPFVPVAMLFSAMASVAGTFDAAVHLPVVSTALTWFAGGAAWLVLRVIVTLGTTVAAVPHAAIDVSIPPAFALAWFPLLGIATWATRTPELEPLDRALEPPPGNAHPRLRRLLRPLPIGLGLVGVLLAITLGSQPDGRLHVTALDIGQGDAILVEAPSGATMLVDGGPDPELTLRRIGANLPFFARRIDLLVLTHPHQDHVAGLVEVLDRFRIGAVLQAGIADENPSFERLLTDADRTATPIVIARAGQRIALDATTEVSVLYPTATEAAAPLPEGDINNGSVVLLLTHGGFTALLTGDAEAPVEAALLARGAIPEADVLKVGHHGSTSSTTPGLLDAARPTVALISDGTGNEYGHPAPETLAALAARPGTAVFRTDVDGDIEVETDGITYRVHTDRGWETARPVHGLRGAGSIARWPSPIARPLGDCSPTPGCPMGSSSIPRVSPALPWP